MEASPARISCWRDLAWPLVVYAIALVPFCCCFLLFYPDERFYLDASLAMFQTGDVMVPRLDDGTPRLNKPVLTYWFMLASFHILGPHLLAARLPFLLAGAGVLWFTCRLARLITNQRQVAQLSVWIMLANPLFWLSCMRCLPDVLLALFALMAVYGYFALRAGQWRDPRAAWLLFAGLGLALGVKGLPALLLMGCIGLHTYLWRRELPPAFTRSMLLPLLAGALIGAAGFAPIVWHHAAETVAEIWRDQFASRLAGRTWGFAYRLPLLLLILAGLHLPWLPACARHISCSPAPLRSRTAWGSFLTLTGTLWLSATVATENCSVRYLFPLFPWWAVALADLVSRCDVDLLARYSRKLVNVIALLALAIAATGLGIAVQSSARSWSAPLLLLVVVAVCGLALWSRRGATWRRLQTACALPPLALLAGFLALAPVLLPELGSQVSSSLESLAGRKDSIIMLGSPCQVSRVRLALAVGPTEVRRIEAPTAKGSLLLVAQTQGSRLHQQGYELVPAARLVERLPLGKCLAAASRGELETFLQSQATVYCWAVRQVPSPTHAAPVSE